MPRKKQNGAVTRWRLYTFRGNFRQLAMITTLKERQRKWGERERKERDDYCLLPTSFSFLASFFWEWHQQPTQGASLFICPSFLCFTSSFHCSFPLCVRFPSWWNYLFCSMCPHARHISLNHVQNYYTYDWQIFMFFFPPRMLQNNQLERLPDDAPWDLPNLLSLWVFSTHIHILIMLFNRRQQAMSNPLATHPPTHLSSITTVQV